MLTAIRQNWLLTDFQVDVHLVLETYWKVFLLTEMTIDLLKHFHKVHYLCLLSSTPHTVKPVLMILENQSQMIGDNNLRHTRFFAAACAARNSRFILLASEGCMKVTFP